MSKTAVRWGVGLVGALTFGCATHIESFESPDDAGPSKEAAALDASDASVGKDSDIVFSDAGCTTQVFEAGLLVPTTSTPTAPPSSTASTRQPT